MFEDEHLSGSEVGSEWLSAGVGDTTQWIQGFVFTILVVGEGGGIEWEGEGEWEKEENRDQRAKQRGENRIEE